MNQTDDASTRARVLDLIVEKGPVSAAQLAKVLCLTPAAVRRHLTVLQEREEIEVHDPATTGKRGRGRPARHYVATAQARSTFAEGYSDIANRALSYLAQVADRLAADASAEGVEYQRGSFIASGPGTDSDRRIRLAYGDTSEEKLVEAARRIGRALRRQSA